MARLPDFRDDDFPLGRGLMIVIVGLILLYCGGMLERITNPQEPCPSPTPCAREEPSGIAPPPLPIYSPQPGIETWEVLNSEHPASEPPRR